MADAMGEGKAPSLRVAFDRRLKLEFHSTKITSDGGLLAYRELDDVVAVITMGMSTLAEGRRGTTSPDWPASRGSAALPRRDLPLDMRSD